MEEETTGQAAAAPEAPPGDETAVATAEPTPAPTFEADHAAELADASNDIDALIEQARQAVEAEAAAQAVDEAGAGDATPPDAPATAADVSPPSADPVPAPVDYAAIAAELAKQGYKVEAPAPPPDPYQQLINELVTERGTDEEYAETRRQALTYVPAEPTDYGAESVARHEQAVRSRNEAAAKLERMDAARRITDRAIRFGRERSLGEVGAAFAALPETYQLSPERAKRVTEPQTATDAVAAIVEQVTERLQTAHQAEIAALTKRFEGEVARAKADRSASAVQQMGRAPQATSAPGGKPAGSPFSALFGQDGLPSDDVIERAKQGAFTGLDLSSV